MSTKRYIKQLVDLIIKKDMDKATHVLSEYLVEKTHSLIMTENSIQNEDEYIPDVTYECTDTSCEIVIQFDKNVSEDFIQKVYEHPSIAALEQTAGGVVDDELFGPTAHKYRCRFDNLDNPQLFAQQYEKVVTKAAYDVLDSFEAEQPDEYDDYSLDRANTNDEADRAEAKWWDERNSIR